MPKQTKAAFTLLEMLLVMVIIMILAGLLLPALHRGLQKARQTQCLNNLRQIGIGFASWANEHEGRFPMQVPYRNGGSLEANRQYLRAFTNLSFAPRHFDVLSNELSTPRIVLCPADKMKERGSAFGSLTSSNISYWVNPRATAGHSAQFLSGDWNLTGLRLGTNADGSISIRVDFDDTLHQNKGNILYADGHVELHLGSGRSPRILPGSSSSASGTRQTSQAGPAPALSSEKGTATERFTADTPQAIPAPEAGAKMSGAARTNSPAAKQEKPITRTETTLVPLAAGSIKPPTPPGPPHKSGQSQGANGSPGFSFAPPGEEPTDPDFFAEVNPYIEIARDMLKGLYLLTILLLIAILAHRYLTRRRMAILKVPSRT